MFSDNASSHGDCQLSKVILKFLPANTTSHLQPLDQGILRAFKARYKKHLLRSLLSKIERFESVSELCKEITLVDAINWIAKAWSEKASLTLTKCFKTTGPSCDRRTRRWLRRWRRHSAVASCSTVESRSVVLAKRWHWTTNRRKH